MENLQQHTRKNNLIISGVPKVPNEDTDSIIVKCADLLHVKLSSHDIDISHRLPVHRSTGTGEKRSSTPSIVVRFVRRSVKNAMLAAARKQSITSIDLIPNAPVAAVHINQHLSPNRAGLLRAAKSENVRLKYIHWGME